MSDPIKTGTRPDGSTFYWFRVSAGRDATVKRIQVYDSFDTEKEAREQHARTLTEIRERRFVARRGPTVSTFLDGWEPAHTRDLEAGTAAKIRHLLRPVRDRLGTRKLNTLTRADIDALADWMLTSGRRRVGKPGTPLSASTVRRTLAVFQRACDDAVDERLMQANPCRRVKRPKLGRPEHRLWSDEETGRFEAAASRDRLYPVITLQCLGFRPEEVCALRWRRDVNLKEGTITVRQARTLADGQAVEKAPKSRAGKRTLPLDESLVSAEGVPGGAGRREARSRRGVRIGRLRRLR